MELKAVTDNAFGHPDNDPDILVITEPEIKELLTVEEAITAVERGFTLAAQGEAVMPPKLYLDLPDYHGDFRAMPAYIDGVAGLKWVSVHPRNQRYDLPSVQAVIILNDPATGRLLAVMDGTYITGLRTGAAGAVAVKYLARKDSSVIGIIGAGTQAETQLLAVSRVMPRIKEVKVFDIRESNCRNFIKAMKNRVYSEVKCVNSVREAAEADIVITVTPSRTPVVKETFVKPGTHINAIGVDAHGKQELESSLTKKSRVFVDDIEQASHSGEINVPVTEGVIMPRDIAGTIGEVITGAATGRRNNDEITVFDSTGLAIQDIICAKYVYQKIIAYDRCGET